MKTILFLALVVSDPALAAEPYPFIGRWGGGPTGCGSPFVFTATTYGPPGEAAGPIKAVKKIKDGFELSFSDGYRIGVTKITPRTMNWFSFASGDGFTLKRCPG